jgi:hypothetical protein
VLNQILNHGLGHLKNNLQLLWKNFLNTRKKEVKPKDVHIDNYHYESHRSDDLPLTIMKDSGPGVKYSYTENSEFSRGAEKTDAVGIDSFEENEFIDPDEADEHQDNRNRNQNSDLSKRYYTHGLDMSEDEFH